VLIPLRHGRELLRSPSQPRGSAFAVGSTSPQQVLAAAAAFRQRWTIQ
jgi:hypothetical protein